jgi:hypothetical protein
MTSPEIGSGTTAYTTLSSALWRLRETLEHVLFKLFETRLVLRSGESRWVAAASRELDAAMQEVRHAEVLRAVDSVALSDQLGLRADASLRQIASKAPPPWGDIFHEHRATLRALTAEVDAGAEVDLAGVTDLADGDPRPAGNPEGDSALSDLDPAVELEIVQRFLVETLTHAQQNSLVTFLR